MANAQTTGESIQKVEVTGSSIKRAEAETISVIQTLTRKDIEQTGKSSIADVVRSISADNNGSISGSFTSGFAGSASGVSLRGLSVSSTLVLINGRRTAPYGFGDDGQRSFVDLNSIPLDAVDRIDILKDGASAIYGSDAIAGVVNIILRQNYVGKTLSANVGQSGHGDGTVTSISGAIGFGDMDTDKFNVFATIDAKKSGEIKQGNRDKWIGQADARPWGGRDQRGGATTSGNGGGSSFLGTLRPISPALGNVTNLPGSCDPINLDPKGGTSGDNGGGGCLWDPVQFATIQPKTENVNLFMRGTLALGANAQGYTEVGIFKSKADTYTTPSGLTGAGFDLINARVNNTNSGADQLLMPANHPDNILRVDARPRWVDASRPRVSNLETTVTRVLAGVKGTYANWDYDTGLMYAESKTDRTQTGYYRTSALRTALNNGTFRIGKGVINSPEVLALVSPTLNNSGTTKSTSLDFKATRELFQLPGGMMGIAVGAEYRKEETNSQSTPYTDINDIVGLGYSASQGSRNVKALYAELAAPVMKELELQFALRSDDYSDYGRSTTPKVGFKFTPASAVAFRGTYAEGFRAPSAAENGNSAVAAFTSIPSDPVRCAVTNLPVDCTLSQQVGAITIGNKNIKPETSKSYSLGMVLEPIKNISLSIDWWKIVRDGEINGSDPGAVVANPAGYPDAVIVRGEPTSNFPGLVGPILMVKAPYLNAGQTKTSGIDLDLRGKYNAGEYGRFNSGVTVTYMKEFTRTNADGTVLEFAGTHGDTNLSGNGGTPKTKVRLTLGWDQGPVNITANMNYVSSISNKNDTAGECLDSDAQHVPYKNCRIASFTTTDLFAKWNVTKQWELTASISNLFDKMAPLDVQTYGRINYNPSLHQSGAVGRYFTLGGRYTF
ncbi:TonB-dependent receptor [Janthinobacterium sp. SUN073]|uniref:TonB-dependent receptor n=1 Tax=Janthinobacterium sp. SUN073 TaxID=3004102 RepID=UPI0025B224E4|nr:TonB-dependent receptor [Janthinobacterium sp. SUN073]MDN2699204.1 TonB-dependent receptor [Janthinobacterium sp. SUN073]